MRNRDPSLRRAAGLTLLLAAALVVACVPQRVPRRASAVASDGRVPPVTAGSASVTASLDPGEPEAELRALLLLIADRRIYEPLVVGQALEAAPAIRRELALVLGRVSDPRGRAPLFRLLRDAEPEVRRAAAFALGRLPARDPEITRRLRAGAVDGDRATGVQAVASMARQEVDLETVVAALAELPPAEMLARLLPSLFRFREAGAVRWGEIGLEQGDATLRRWAAYGLAREPQGAAVPALRRLLDAADPWVAGWAARALGRVGDRTDLERFDAVLDRAEPGPVIQALRAARTLIARGEAAPPSSWRDRLPGWLDDGRVGVRITALELAPVFLRDDALGALLVERFASGKTRRERELALLALAEGADPRAETLVVDASRDADPVMRVRAAEAAGRLGAERLLAVLAEDDVASVRAAALEARLAGSDSSAAADLAVNGLRDGDAGVRASALEWLAEQAHVATSELVAAAQLPDRLLIVRHALVPALRARAEAAPAERAAAVTVLEALAASDAYTVRRAAGDALEALGRPRPALGPAAIRPIAIYREVLAHTFAPRNVEIETASGTIRLRLDCPAVPLTCLSFLQLAVQGFFDGLTWHRVVPDFVIQGGDPRGDGRGGPGVPLRDEPNPRHYRRGVVGMARSARDTAGSQFFITLSEQPHLDGDYTAFGAVVGGEEILDRIVQGDRIERVVEVPVQP